VTAQKIRYYNHAEILERVHGMCMTAWIVRKDGQEVQVSNIESLASALDLPLTNCATSPAVQGGER
jgi:hypothetical protein